MRTIALSMLLVSGLVPPLPAQGNATLSHARQEFDAKHWDTARQEFSLLARAAPNDATPVLYLGKIAFQQGDSDESIRQFERCVAIDEKNAACHAWLGNALGLTAQRTSKFKLPMLAKRTKKEFDRAVELDPGNLDGRLGELQYYLNAPGFLGGSIEKAREQAAEIEAHSKMRGAVARGIIADRENDAKASEVAYERAVALAPDSVPGYNGLLALYTREKRWAEAFTTLEHIAARVSTEPNTAIRFARLAYLSGEQLQRGEEAARRWIANPPAQVPPVAKATAHLRLGQLYEKTSRKELARSEYQQALSINARLDEARKSLDALR